MSDDVTPPVASSALVRFVVEAIDGVEAPTLTSTRAQVEVEARLREALAAGAEVGVEGSVYAFRVHAHATSRAGLARLLGVAYRGELATEDGVTTLRGRFAISRVARTFAWLFVAGLSVWTLIVVVALPIALARGASVAPVALLAASALAMLAGTLLRVREARRTGVVPSRVLAVLRAALASDA